MANLTEQNDGLWRPNEYGKTYIMTLDALYRLSLANLGPMDKGTFESYRNRAQAIGKERQIPNPSMIIDFILKEPNALGAKEQPYPISKDEWDIFVKDAETMAEKMPDVHVVDGDKYTAPI